MLAAAPSPSTRGAVVFGGRMDRDSGQTHKPLLDLLSLVCFLCFGFLFCFFLFWCFFWGVCFFVSVFSFSWGVTSRLLWRFIAFGGKHGLLQQDAIEQLVVIHTYVYSKVPRTKSLGETTKLGLWLQHAEM